VYVAVFMTRGRSAVRAQPWPLQRLLVSGLYVARCALVRTQLAK